MKMKIYVIANYRKQKTVRSMEQLLRWAGFRGVTVLLSEKNRRHIGEKHLSVVEFLEEPDAKSISGCRFILTIGGDGTLIRGSALAAESGIPIAGVNTGTLGFLACIEPDEVWERMEDLYHEREYRVENRLCLTGLCLDGRQIPCAINDIVLQKAAHGGLAVLDLCYGEEKVGHYRCDGLIVTTPTGSTAYAYAAGGPAMHPESETLSVLPICPQNRMSIPLIVGTSRAITVEVKSGTMRLLADGTDYGALRKGQQMTVQAAGTRVRLIRFTGDWGILNWQDEVGRL